MIVITTYRLLFFPVKKIPLVEDQTVANVVSLQQNKKRAILQRPVFENYITTYYLFV